MVAYFQRYISAWMDGTEALGDGEYRTYDVICNLIYLNDGPIKANERGIAGRCNQHVLAFRKHFAALVAAGKLSLTADGKITNKRAALELDRIGTRKPGKPPSNPPRTPAAPQPNPPATPGAPQLDLGRTPAEPPPDAAAKPLKNMGATGSERPIEKRRRDKTRQDDKAAEADASATRARTPIKADDGWPDDAWVQFWVLYPNKVGKGDAFKKFQAARKKRVVTFEDLMAALRRYVNKTDDREWCNPATWLYQERWEDKPATVRGEPNAPNRQSTGGGFIRGRIEGAKRRAEKELAGDEAGPPADPV